MLQKNVIFDPSWSAGDDYDGDVVTVPCISLPGSELRPRTITITPWLVGIAGVGAGVYEHVATNKDGEWIYALLES